MKQTRSRRAILTEIQRLKRRQYLASTGYGKGVALAMQHALQWAINDSDMVPMAAAVMADEGAKYAKRLERAKR